MEKNGFVFERYFNREASRLHYETRVAMAEIRYEAGKKETIEEEPVCEFPASDETWRPDAGFWVGATWIAAGVGCFVTNWWASLLFGTPAFPEISYSSVVLDILAVACVWIAPASASNRRAYDKSKRPPFGMSNAQYNGL